MIRRVTEREERAMPRDLLLTSPALGGADVLALQTKLEALGYAPGPLDGIYGVATESAVRAFQRDHDLQIDGIVGPRTRAALGALRKPSRRRANQRSPSDVGLQALDEALRHVGTRERPRGSNRTMFGRWFGIDGVPWCNIFMSYCFAVGARYVLCAGFKGPGVYRNGCTYVPTTEAWLRATGMWTGRTTPLAGDLAIFDWNGGVPDHIGIVASDLEGGRFETIEGNTAPGRDSNGGQVLRRLRYLSQVTGFGRVVR